LEEQLTSQKRFKGLETDLSEADLKKIYRAMLLTRLFDTKSMNLQRQGRIGFYVPCSGQEAAQIGSAFALRADDWMFPTYRDVGVAILRGVELSKLFAHLMGNSDDEMLGKQMPSHWGYREVNFVSVASPIATHLPVATGTAMAMRLEKKDTVVLAYHGDGATSEGEFHAAYNFAGVYKAPIVFICENNGWAISVPVARQTASQTLAVKAEAYGFGGMRIDGNDVLAVYEATKKAVEKARRGGGPTMVECLTYRMGPHSTSDDPNRYRTREEFDIWQKRDPVERFRRTLVEAGLWDDSAEAKLRSEIDGEIALAIEKEEKVALPSPVTMFEGVYSKELKSLSEQREYSGLDDASKE
jgi:pyruvate dehydrogenase E1 component alpha subunit